MSNEMNDYLNQPADIPGALIRDMMSPAELSCFEHGWQASITNRNAVVEVMLPVPSEYAWSLDGEEYHDRLDTREAAIAELDGSGGFTGRVIDAYDACGECDIAEVIVDQVESWLSDSVTSDDFIIEVTEEQKDALNTIVWQWLYKNVTPNRWTVTDVQQHDAALLSAADTEVKNG